jgi:hypothetical protein
MNPLHQFERRGRRDGRLALAIATVSMVIGLNVSSGTTASASVARDGSVNAGSGSSTAIVDPLLEMFEFGNTVGLPLACTDVGSVVSIIGAATNSSKTLSPITVQLDKECGELSAEGNAYLQQAMVESQGLSLINPLINPVIADLADGFSTIGTQYGPELSPFGPTVVGLGGMVAFFEGS